METLFQEKDNLKMLGKLCGIFTYSCTHSFPLGRNLENGNLHSHCGTSVPGEAEQIWSKRLLLRHTVDHLKPEGKLGKVSLGN